VILWSRNHHKHAQAPDAGEKSGGFARDARRNRREEEGGPKADALTRPLRRIIMRDVIAV